MELTWFNSFYSLDFYSMTLYFYYYENNIIYANNHFVSHNNLSYYSLADWTLFLYKDDFWPRKFFNYSLYLEIPDIFSDFFLRSNCSSSQSMIFSYNLSHNYSLNYLPKYNTSCNNLDYFVHCTVPTSKIEPFCWLWNQQICSMNYQLQILDKSLVDFEIYSNYVYDFFSYWYRNYNPLFNTSHIFFFEQNIWNISRIITWNFADTLDYLHVKHQDCSTYEILFGSENLVQIFNNSIFIELNFNSGNLFELLSSQTFIYLVYYFGLKYYFIPFLFF